MVPLGLVWEDQEALGCAVLSHCVMEGSVLLSSPSKEDGAMTNQAACTNISTHLKMRTVPDGIFKMKTKSADKKKKRIP